LDALQVLPKFRPPDFEAPLPVPESPEVTGPLPVPESPEVMPSTPQNVTRVVNTSMITWVDAVKPALPFSHWPEAASDSNASCASCGKNSPLISERSCSFSQSGANAPWLQGIPKHSERLIESIPHSCSVAEESGTTMVSAPRETHAAPLEEHTSASETMLLYDILCDTMLVFPEVERGAVLATLESPCVCIDCNTHKPDRRACALLAEMAPSPADVPRPIGFSVQVPADSPNFAFYLPVPESPDTTSATTRSCSDNVFTWTSAPVADCGNSGDSGDSGDQDQQCLPIYPVSARSHGARSSTGGTEDLNASSRPKEASTFYKVLLPCYSQKICPFP